MNDFFAATTPKNREIADYLHEVFLANLNLGSLKALETALENTTSKFELIPNLEISVGTLSGNVMYIGGYAGGSVKVSRNGVTQTILSTGKNQKLVASGFTQKKDKFYFDTNDHQEIYEKKSFFESLFKKPKVLVVAPQEFERDSQSKKVTLSIGIILLLILGISIYFGIRQKNINETRLKYEGKLSEASQNLDEAIGLVSVSPDKARELFVAAQEKLVEIEGLNVKDSAISELRRKVDEEKSKAFGEYSPETNLFLDLGLLSSGFKGSEISSSQGDLFILDKEGKKVVRVEIETKKSSVVAGSDKIPEVAGLAAYSDRVFILDNEGVKEVGDTLSTAIEKSWDGEALIFGFAGNLYVLDKQGNQIYRYAGSGEIFGGKQNWLSDGTKPDFANAKSWVIDGAIYVLNSSGKVQKFSQGSPQSFRLAGVYPEIVNIEAMYANDETEFLYILDKLGKRVVVVDKKGTYKAQYMASEIGSATGLVVSEEDNLPAGRQGKIILLTGEKLLSIDLN